MAARKLANSNSTILAAAAFVAGIVLRYRFIVLLNRPSDPANILGDAGWYVAEAVHFFDPAFAPHISRTLFPPGAPIYFAVLRMIDPSMQLLDLVQWLSACLVPLILGVIAERLYGRSCALFVLGFSSLYFPLWEYFGYFISEGPFLLSLQFAFLLFVLSLQARSKGRAAGWGLIAGLMLGASAAFKSCALFSAAAVAVALFCGRKKCPLRPSITLLSASIGLAIVLIPVSLRATQLNEGRFLLIANDAHRTFLLGHQGRVGLTWWHDQKRNFRMNFINPSAAQHSYLEERSYPFGPYEAGPNYSAGWQWIKENPLDALLLSVEHVFDMFAVALPWPGYFRSYAGWTIFFNELFIVLILFPAAVYLLHSRKKIFCRESDHLADLAVFAAAISIYIIAFLFLGEGRYRVCYDGFMIILAARAFFPGPANMLFEPDSGRTDRRLDG